MIRFKVQQLAIAVLVMVLGLASAGPALACSCAPMMEPQEARERADAIFSGTVLSLSESGGMRQVRIQVDRAWKGAKCGVVVIETGAGELACGYEFQKGETYLVYGFLDGKKLTTSLCERTRPIGEAGEDLQVLGEPSATCTK